jgi:hypothetical protein
MAACPPTEYAFSLGGRFSQAVHHQTLYPIPDGATTVNYTTTFESDTLIVSGGVFMEQLDSAGNVLLGGRTLATDTTTLPFTTLTDSIHAGATDLAVGGAFTFVGGPNPGHIQFAGTINWFGTCDNAVQCVYGTQVQSGVADSIAINGGVLELVANYYEVPVLQEILAITIGSIIVVDVLCGTLPVGIPASFADAASGTYPLNPSLADALQYLRYLLWSRWCQCSPAPGGFPAPVSPPVPVPIPPTSPPPPGGGGGGSPPPAVCDNTDPCTQFNNILKLLGTLNLNIQNVQNTVNNLKNATPTSANYTHGAVYPDLSGTGSIVVSGIRGLSVSCTTIPTHIGRTEEFDPEFEELGSIQYWGGYGWMKTQFIHHASWMTLDAPALVQHIEYSFDAGVVADITLLVPAP